MSTSYLEGLLEEALLRAKESETARAAMMGASRGRQEAIFALHMEGLSVREVAARISTSAAVVQAALRAANLRRSKLRGRKERIPYELHVELSRKLRTNEHFVRRIGISNLQRMQRTNRNALARQWTDSWHDLLNGPLETLEARMLAEDPIAIEMRQLSPFAGALTNEERLAAIKRAAAFASQ